MQAAAAQTDRAREISDAARIDALVGSNTISTLRAEEAADQMSVIDMIVEVEVVDVIESLPEPLKSQFLAHYRSEIVIALVEAGDDA